MKADLIEPQIVTRKGRAVSVIIPIEVYEELLERVGWRRRTGDLR